jgi:hypothetical protein
MPRGGSGPNAAGGKQFAASGNCEIIENISAMPHVFLSYSHKDMDFVKKFDKELSEALASRRPGVTVWRDKKELKQGDVFNKKIEPSVRSACFFVAMVSGAWEQSAACQEELRVFMEDAAHEGLLTSAILAAGATVKLPQVLKDAEYTKFYRIKEGRNVAIATNTKAFRDAVAVLADDICAKLPASSGGATQADTVVRLRDRVKDKTTAACGSMRILGMSKPVPIDGIYTDIHILEKRSRDLSLDPSKIGYTNFREFGLGERKKERIPSKQALESHKHLMIFGPPGAGKTTFLRRLAMECLSGSFLPEKVPFFLGLKDYSEREGSPKLLACLDQLGGESIVPVLESGHALILLDGLDEVRDTNVERVRREIDALTRNYARSTIIVTCRNQASQYVFERLTEVELADFTPEQIQQFVRKWFTEKGLPEKIAPFLEKRSPEHIHEMARSPLLLTMLCLNFERNLDFASNRAAVYEEAFNTLLKEWDGSRGHERGRPYERLGIEERQQLLAEIAYERFLDDEYIFEENSLRQQIEEYFESRPGFLQPKEVLDGKVILDLVESQHGILVRRSNRHYSFAHLTFQEYLCAKRIHDDPARWQEVGAAVGEARWAEVFQLAVSLRDPNFVLREMKRHIDKPVSRDPKIQEALVWCCRKTTAVAGDQPEPALRISYLALDRDLALARALARARARDLALARARARARALDLSLALDLDLDLALDLDHDLALALDLALDRARARARALDLDRALARALELIRRLPKSPVHERMRKELQSLKARIPERQPAEWWLEHGPQWLTDFRQFLEERRDLRLEWNWSREQLRVLHRFLDANQLLLMCMNSAPGLTSANRDWLNQTILLPAAEIDKMPPPNRSGRRRLRSGDAAEE